MPQLSDRLSNLRARVRAAEERAGRAAGSVELLAVSKGAPVEAVVEAWDAGQQSFGENRVQELEEKRAAFAQLRPSAVARWELIGPLQGNKARRALAVADRIATVDRIELLEKLVTLTRESATKIHFALQVNIDDDPAKAGFAPDELRAALPQAAALLSGTNLHCDGLFTVGRLTNDPAVARGTFSAFADFGILLREEAAAAGIKVGDLLSAGMSTDFELAIEQGATQVRLGSALFGARG
jgi:pyridoxal phosphate enzyme (YggS family)